MATMTPSSAASRSKPDAQGPSSDGTGAELDMADGEQQPQQGERERIQRLQALGESLEKTLKEAIDGRAQSGIEDIWTEDEEHFEGIDDKNRGVIDRRNSSKPAFQQSANAYPNESILFVNITRPYVEAAAAKIGDITMPTDGSLAWKLTETPIADLIEKAKGGLDPEVIEGLASVNANEQTALEVLQAEQQHAQALLDEAKDKAKRASKRIEDWQIEGNYNAAMRLVIDDATRCGTGVLKGPVPEMRRKQMYRDGSLLVEMGIEPVSKHIDYWNCFPDPGCGTDIHKGRYHWERDFLTEPSLAALKDDESYIGQQIDLCLEEGPQSKKYSQRKTADGRTLEDKDVFEIYYFYGWAKREDIEAAGVKVEEGKHPMIPAIVTMVNGHVIKGALNPMDSGDFPYDYLRWQRRKNSPWGTGVGRQIRTPQQIVVAATRTMLTNAGRAAGPLLVLRNGVKGTHGTNDIIPWAVYTLPASDLDGDTQKAAQLIEIPALTKELMDIIQLGLKLAEDVTGLPLLLQGQVGGAPDTYGGQQLVDRNAAGVLRRIARNLDDDMTEPHLRRYYDYLLLYGPDEMEKGEFILDARGSTALVEREIVRQESQTLLQASLNPQFGLDPKKTMAENLRANNRNPKDYQYDPAKQEQIDQMSHQPPVDQGAEATKAVGQMRAQTEHEKTVANTQIKQKELITTSLEAAKQRQHDKEMANLKLQQSIIDFAQQRGINLDGVKAGLAETVMKLRTQTELAHADHTHQRVMQVLKPPVEPPGRAAPDKSFQQ